MTGEPEQAVAAPDAAVPDPITPRAPTSETQPGSEASTAAPEPSEPANDTPRTIPMLPVVEVENLDWRAVRRSVDPRAIRSRMRDTVEAFEALLDRADGPGLLFDSDRANAADRAIQVCDLSPEVPVWIIGDLHGDLLALEAALALIDARPAELEHGPSRIIFLGDLFDDEGMGLEVLLRVFELILAAPERVCVVVGNHDEALSYDGNRFSSSVSPSDFADFLNANLAHEWIERAGKLAVRFFAQAPRALFLPDGLLVAHAGFPLSDLHARLAETSDWNDPACLSDFAWTRAHPTARRKMPNRFTRGSQFGHEDFAAFRELSTRLGRPVTHMVRGHDHVEERYIAYPAYREHPVLTTVALSRRLPRESFGPYVRVPTLARHVEGALPQVHRLHIPAEIVTAVFPEPVARGCGEDIGS
ncbi:metallophosphoesterase [uncultured Sphingomonas sp.]|uniref:metallophosphoesterase n=1 Tax=uncultured Sphingomonas sp. TaxID=158754 RepID=UPI0035CBC8CA